MKNRVSESTVGNFDRIRKALTFLVPFVYLAVLSNSVSGEPFWSDDPEELLFVRSRTLLRLLSGHDAFGYFRPVKNVLWFLFSRLEPFGFEWCHVVAIAIGVLSFFSVRSLCRRIFRDEWKALAAAAVWLLSPTLVSSAAWLSCANIQTMVAFAAMSIVFHDRAWETSVFRRSRVLGADVFLFFALVSYECAVALGPILLLFDWTLRPGRLRGANARKAHVCHWTVIAVYAILRATAGSVGEMQHRWIEASRFQLILSSPFFTARHFADWFCPFKRFSVGGSYIWGEVPPIVLIGCAAIGVAVLIFAILARKRFPALSFSLLFSLFAFAPASNCLGFGNGPFGDYYLSLASVGLAAGCVETAWLLSGVRGTWRAPALVLAGVFVLVRLAAVPEAARWARFWSNADLAYAEGARNNPNSIQNLLGSLRNRVAEGDWNEALEIGLRIESKTGPDSPLMSFVYSARAIHAIVVEKDKVKASEALVLFGRVSSERESERQILFYEGLIAETIDKDPDAAERKYMDALRGSHEKDLLVGCAKALARIRGDRNEWDGAVDLLEQAAKIAPEDISLMWNLAIAYKKAGNKEESDNWLENVRMRTGNPALQIK